jgi:hypothetical protein
MIQHFFSHWLGLDNASGPLYLFWSGFFGDITIFGAILGIYYKHNCHSPKCLRIGKHNVNGTPFCSKHHPGDI